MSRLLYIIVLKSIFKMNEYFESNRIFLVSIIAELETEKNFLPSLFFSDFNNINIYKISFFYFHINI